MLNDNLSHLDLLPPAPAHPMGWPWTATGTASNTYNNDISWPRISIVTPSYNQGQYLEETIRSVLLQGYPNLEYIIIDGGSQDHSLEIIQKYQPWIAYWQSQPDQGQADALNQGFAHATGEICAYLNSDDLLLPGALVSVAIAFAQTRCTWLASRVLVGESINQAQIWEPGANTFAGFVTEQTFAQQGVFWRADALPQPYFDPQRRYILDHCFFVELYRRYGSPYIYPHLTALFRNHPASKTSTLQDILEQESFELTQAICSQVPDTVAAQIVQERQRQSYKVEIHQLLNARPNCFQERFQNLGRALTLLVRDPYPGRDRIFISATLKLLIRLLVA